MIRMIMIINILRTCRSMIPAINSLVASLLTFSIDYLAFVISLWLLQATR